MNRKIIFGLAMALLVAGCGDKAPTPDKNATAGSGTTAAAPTGTVWSETAVETAEGGIMMGNPNAPVKLVEYASLTCPVCARFSEDSKTELREMVNKGSVSWEYRPFLVHGAQDVPPALLARCNGAGAFFALAEQMYATQPEWVGKMQSITPAEKAAAGKMAPPQLIDFIANKMGLIAFVQQRGISADKAKACLADPAGLTRLETIMKAADDQFKVSGTPTFILNGRKVENAIGWADLKPKLRDAGA